MMFYSTLSPLRYYTRFFTIRNNSTLVLANCTKNGLDPNSLNVISAAQKIGHKITGLVLGSEAEKAGKELTKVSGVDSVYYVSSAQLNGLLSERVTSTVLHALRNTGQEYTHVLCAADSLGKSVMPRVAALLDVSAHSEVMEVKDSETFVRSIYAGNALLTFKSLDNVKVCTIRTMNFDPAQLANDSGCVCQPLDGVDYDLSLSEYVGQQLTENDRPELSSASIVVSGGRALKSAENFDMIYKLADKLKAGVGASRAAVDAGYVSNDLQVGQTGKIIAPDLYIAIGISGAIQHLAGMKDSKTIVAINKDADAPIFQVSDYGLVADLFKAVPELIEKI